MIPRGWASVSTRILIAALALGLAIPAAGSPEQDKREELLEQLGLGGPKKKKEPEPEEPEPEEPEPEEPDATPPESPDGGEPTPPGPSEPAAPDRSPRVTYSGRIHAMLQASCAGCHRAGGSAGATRLVLSGEVGHDFPLARKLVDPRRPDASTLLTKALGESHGGGTTLSKGGSKHKALRAWIAAGAPKGGGTKSVAPAPTPAPVVEPPSSPGPEPSPPKPKTHKRPSKPASTVPSQPATPGPEGSSAPATTSSAPPTAEPPATTLAFAPKIHDQLLTKCGQCHREGAIGGRSALMLTGDVAADYDATVALVDRDAPARSRLLTKAIGTEHGGGATIQVGSDPYRDILAWIEGGAVGPTAPVPGEPAPGEPEAAIPTVAVDATSGASVPPKTSSRLGNGTPLGSAGSGLPYGLPFGLRLNGKLDFSYERRDFRGHPFGPGRNRFQTYHHFLFLSRAGADDPFGFNVELLTQAFYEFNARVAPKGRNYGFLFKAGKIMVPFGPEPLFHKSYGGRSGFDQEILPFVWAQPGVAVASHVQAGPVMLSNDLYAVQGYALRDADGVLNLQGDVSTIDDFRAAIGDRIGLGWNALTGWYSFQFNYLGFDRRLFMQAFDLELWRVPDVPVLEDLVLGVGGLRADVSGGGPGRDYYHFGSYATIGYYPLDWLYLQYRAGLRTTDNRRGLYFDPARLDERDRGTHNLSILGRYKGFYGGVQVLWNLEKANELDDDFLRVTVGYEF
jgi:mono/diheme cytochrome c family protein